MSFIKSWGNSLRKAVYGEEKEKPKSQQVTDDSESISEMLTDEQNVEVEKPVMKKKGPKLSKSVKPSIYTSSTSNNNNNNNNNNSDIFNDLDSSYSPSSNYSKTDAPGDAKMKTAYDVSRQLMMDRLDESEKKILETATDSDIIVVEGTYDHIHSVLGSLKIPFTLIARHQVSSFKFRPDQTVYVNCPSDFPADGARKLAEFVHSGGCLITTDWALKHVIEVGFPGTVKYNGKSTADAVVGIEVLDKSDEVVMGFMDEDKSAAPQWWLEGSSYPLEIIDKNKVKKLIKSDELASKWGSDAVVVRIDWGKGCVYHMISHFYLQKSASRNEKGKGKATSYFATKGAKTETLDKLSNIDEQLDYATVQSAYTSSEFVTRAYINQKKKASKF